MTVAAPSAKARNDMSNFKRMEVATRFELAIKVLQTSALPLGYATIACLSAPMRKQARIKGYCSLRNYFMTQENLKF